MRIIVPAFPSYAAVAEYDHKRYFMPGTFEGFTGVPGGVTPTEPFAEPYNACRFKVVDEDATPMFPPEVRWTEQDRREIRVTLWKPRAEEYDTDPDPRSYL